MKVFREFKQATVEWHEQRRKRITASNADRIFTPGGKLSKQSTDYMAELVSENFTPFLPDRAESYTSRSMAFGQASEDEARRYFSFRTSLDVEEVGGILSTCERIWASPDGLIDGKAGLEIKVPEPKTHVSYLMAGELPEKYKPQIHTSLIASGFDCWYFLSYSVGMPPLLVKIEPDGYTKELRVAIEMFWEEYQKMLGKLKEMQ